MSKMSHMTESRTLASNTRDLEPKCYCNQSQNCACACNVASALKIHTCVPHSSSVSDLARAMHVSISIQLKTGMSEKHVKSWNGCDPDLETLCKRLKLHLKEHFDTASSPKVNETSRALSDHPVTSLSGSAHNNSQHKPVSGTSVGRIRRRNCSNL